MKLKDVDWFFASYHILYHVFVLIAAPIYLSNKIPSAGIIVSAILFYLLTIIGIAGGYHRYFSHRAYQARRTVQITLLAFATMAIQGSAFFWTYTHRMHHKHTDEEKDPHNIKKGFFYAHMGWFLTKEKGTSIITKPIDKTLIADLYKDKLLRFQHKYFLLLSFGLNAIVTLIIGTAFSDLWGAFIFAWWLRILVVNHCTWFINSLAHTIGDKPYAKEQSAVDNFVMAVLTLGEGYHNYHHAFPNDYRNGIKWHHFDPIKWIILLLSGVKLVSKVNYIDPCTTQKKMLTEDKKMLLKGNLDYHDKQKIGEVSRSIEQKLLDLLALKRSKADKEIIKRHEQVLKGEWRAWTSLVNRLYKNLGN